MDSTEFISLPGQVSFREVHALQLKLLEQRIADQIPDTIILCEHTPTITRGRGLQRSANKDIQPPKPLLHIPSGTEYIEIERGGDLTWHGPGQLVVYPIVKLRDQDINRWIRFLENQWIQIFEQFGVRSTTKAGGSGVWIGGERKIMSVGIALRRWVSYHGIAVNIVNDLKGFQDFDPCGYSSQVMTRAQDLPSIPREMFQQDWRAKWEQKFREQWA